jgi:hypothetical protein
MVEPLDLSADASDAHSVAPRPRASEWIARVVLVTCALVSVPLALRVFAGLLASENFGWGIFGVYFVGAPLAIVEVISAIVLSFVAKGPSARTWIITAWVIAALSLASVVCAVLFARASGC